MKKVKIFSGPVGPALEKRINKWMQSDEVASIYAEQVSTCFGTNELGESFVNCTIVLFYEI